MRWIRELGYVPSATEGLIQGNQILQACDPHGNDAYLRAA